MSASLSPATDLAAAQALPLRTRLFAFGAMCVGFFIALLDIQIVSSSLAEIGGGLSASTDEVAWIQTSYLIAEIIVIPLSGWLSRVMSTRWLFAVSAIGFTLSSLLCGAAWNIGSMVVFRALQGFLGGSMIPTVFTTAFVYFNGNQRIIASAVIGGIASLAPTLGPTIGGWITENYSWHWLFFVNLAPGVFIAIVVPWLVRIDRPNPSLLRGGDYLGMALLAVFLGGLEYVLEEGARWDWLDDPTIRALSIVASVAGVAFVWRSLVATHPVVDLRALGNRNFALGCFFSFASGVGIFATIYLTPLFLARVRGYSPLDIGLTMLSTGVFQLLAIPIYALVARRIDLRWLLLFGLTCFAAGLWRFTPLTHDWSWREFLFPQALRGFAQQFTVAPIVTLTLGGLAPERLKVASGLFNLMRNLGGAIGIAMCGTLLNDRMNLHFLRLAERVDAANVATREFVQRVSASQTLRFGGDAIHGHAIAVRRLFQLTWREAQTQAFADAFLLMAVFLALAACLVPLLRRPGSVASGPSPNAH